MSSTSPASRAFGLPSALISFGLIYAWTLTYPLNIDSSVHAYMASLLLKGYWPYVSVWENNFPGTILFVHLPELLLFGKSALGFHVWDMLWQLGGAFFLYRLIDKEAGQRAAWLGVVMMAIYYLSLDNLFVGQRDGFATVVILGVFWLLTNWRSRQSAIYAGLICGVAVLIRPTNEIYVLAFALLVLWRDKNRDGLIQSSVFVIASQLWLAVFVLFYAAHGWLGEFYTIAFRFNTEVYAHTLPISEVFYPLPHYWLFVIGAIVATVLWRSRLKWEVVILLLASIISLLPQKRYLYQYHTTFVLIILLSAVGWDRMINWVADRSKRFKTQIASAGAMAIAVACLVLLTRGTSQEIIAKQLLHRGHSSAPIRWEYDDSQMSGYQVLDSVGDYLKLHVPDGRTAQMIGEYCYPLFEAGLRPATRFITFHSLMLRGSAGDLTEFQKRWRHEILDSVNASKPVYIVIADAPEYARGHLNGLLGHEILEKDFTELGSAIDQHYHLETTIGAFTLYRSNVLTTLAEKK